MSGERQLAHLIPIIGQSYHDKVNNDIVEVLALTAHNTHVVTDHERVYSMEVFHRDCIAEPMFIRNQAF